MEGDANLLTDALYPFLLSDGERRWVSFLDLPGTEDGHRLVRPDTGDRALDGAALEAFVGFAQLALAPEGDVAWRRMLRRGLGREEVAAACTPWAHRFWLYEARPFQADLGAKGSAEGVDRLLIDSHGENAATNNTDINSRSVRGLDARLAGLALMHLHRHAPQGGRGYRTSIAGGGPLRTFVEPIAPDGTTDICRTVLANLLPREVFAELGAQGPQRADREMPWHETREATVTRANATADWLYFGTPRLVRLGEPGPGGRCDVSGRPAGALLTSIQRASGGPSLDAAGWTHPLTPYRGLKAKVAPVRALTVPPEFGWRDRFGIFQKSGSADGFWPNPARVVERARGAEDLLGRFAVFAFGHAFSEAACVGWVQARRVWRDPPGDAGGRAAFDAVAERAIEHAAYVSQRLDAAVNALLEDIDDAPERQRRPGERRREPKGEVFRANTGRAFWARSEDVWTELEDRLLEGADQGLQDHLLRFHGGIAAAAEDTYRATFGPEMRRAPESLARHLVLLSRTARAVSRREALLAIGATAGGPPAAKSARTTKR